MDDILLEKYAYVAKYLSKIPFSHFKKKIINTPNHYVYVGDIKRMNGEC